jgi:hypothetical protein
LLPRNHTACPGFHFHPDIVTYVDMAVIVEGRLTGTHQGNGADIGPRHGARAAPCRASIPLGATIETR